MKVVLNIKRCHGHARCEDICPEIFSTDAVEGKCVIVKEDIPEELVERAQLAVRNCPEGALRLSREREPQQ